MENELITSQLTAGYATAALIQWLKGQSWFPFCNDDTAALNRATSMVMSVVAAIGLHLTFDSTAGVLTVTGLTLTNMLHAAWASVQQYAITQAAYKGIIKS